MWGACHSSYGCTFGEADQGSEGVLPQRWEGLFAVEVHVSNGRYKA